MPTNPRTAPSVAATAAAPTHAGSPMEVLAAGGSDRWLTDMQLQVIDLIVSGVPITTIAHAQHVGRSTIYEWRKQPAFIAEEARRREFLRSERQDQMLGLLDDAAGVIRSALADRDVTVAIKVLQAYAPDRLLHAAGGLRTLEQMVRIEADKRCRDAQHTVADDGAGLDITLQRASITVDSRADLRQHVAHEVLAAAADSLAHERATQESLPTGRGQMRRGRRCPPVPSGVDDQQLALFDS